MELLVVPRDSILDVVRVHPGWAIVSMWDAGAEAWDLAPHRGRLLRTFFDDMTHISPSAIAAGYVPPQRDDALAIVSFLRAVGAGSGLAVHCMQGVSRSTATALAAAAVLGSPAHAVGRLVAAADEAERLGLRDGAPVKPNPRLVALFDEVLGLGGDLLEPTLDTFWPERTLAEVWQDARS